VTRITGVQELQGVARNSDGAAVTPTCAVDVGLREGLSFVIVIVIVIVIGTGSWLADQNIGRIFAGDSLEVAL